MDEKGYQMKPKLLTRILLSFCLLFLAANILPPDPVQATSKPVIILLDPAQASNDFETEVYINGLNFLPLLDEPVAVAVNGVLLEADKVEWLADDSLRIRFPWGLEPGLYPVQVANNPADPLTWSDPVDFTVTEGVGINKISDNHLFGGTISHVIYDPWDPAYQTLYASAERVGFYKSTDDGASWLRIFTDNGMGKIYPDPTTPNRLYADREDEGLFRSDDGGLTWKSIFIPGDVNGYQRPYVAPDGTLYSAFQNGGANPDTALRRSTNAGAAWQLVNPPAEEAANFGVKALAFHPQNAGFFYAGTLDGKVYKTTDGALTWQLLGSPAPTCVEINSLVLHPTNPDVFYAVCGGNQGYIYRYDTLIWTQVDLTHGDGVHFPLSSNNAIDLYINPDNPLQMRVAAWRGGYSVDGGATWIESGPFSRETLSMAVHPTQFGTVFYGGHPGLYKTANNGLDWTLQVQGIDGVVARHMAVDPVNPRLVYITNDNDLYRSTDGAQSWQRLGDGLWGPVAVDPMWSNRVYQIHYAGLRRSTNQGDDFTILPLPRPAGFEDQDRYTIRYDSLVLAPPIPDETTPVMIVTGSIEDGTILQYPQSLTTGVIWRSLDRGNTWQVVLVAAGFSGVDTAVFDPQAPHIWYAGAAEWVGGDSIMRVLFSSDSGQTWEVLPGYGDLSGEGIEDMAVNPVNAQVLAAYGGGLRASADLGQSWSPRRSPSMGRGTYFTELLYTPGPSPYLYAATSRGLFRSGDDTRTWQWFARGLGRNYIGAMDLASQGSLNTLYLSTSGGFATGDLSAAASAKKPVGGGLYRVATLGALQLRSPADAAVLPWDALEPELPTFHQTLQWEQIRAADRYEVQVATNPGFKSARKIKLEGFANSSVELTRLKAGRTYYWRVRYVVDGVVSSWSAPQSFIAPQTPAAPVLRSPASLALGTTTAPRFEWKSARNTPTLQYFELNVDQDADFSSPEIIQQALWPDQFTEVVGLAEFTRYNWRIRACIGDPVENERNCGAWSIARALVTAPATVLPVNPVDLTQRRPIFTWPVQPEGTGRYRILVSKSPSLSKPLFTRTVTDQDLTTPDVIEYTAPINLPASVPLYWAVQPQIDYLPKFWGLRSTVLNFTLE